MKTFLLTALFLFAMLSSSAYPQYNTAKHAIFFEAGGHGIIFSANYERFIGKAFGE